MAHFAQVDASGVVQWVIVVDNQNAPDPAPSNSEPLGQRFISEVLGFSGTWKQTSYNSNFRGRYAGQGYTYDADGDVFIPPQPDPSWTLDDNYDWQPPEGASNGDLLPPVDN